MIVNKAPIFEYVEKLQCLFAHDTNIKIVYNMRDSILDIYTADALKGMALKKLLPEHIQIDNDMLSINIIAPSDERFKQYEYDLFSLYEFIFKGNTIIKEIKISIIEDQIYIVFKNQIAQYGDIYTDEGVTTTLYSKIATTLFIPDSTVVFCEANQLREK